MVKFHSAAIIRRRAREAQNNNEQQLPQWMGAHFIHEYLNTDEGAKFTDFIIRWIYRESLFSDEMKSVTVFVAVVFTVFICSF